ncbi:DUF6226 family protein [Cutibacterium namnetense]|uniref:Uncharacterized protein n=1 Tax=[Propionibacterium] namnetense SK182B-JCVI TaxID=1051006 RepID=F9NWS1_9ACTN|nr:DUF6226 family protein [Cutibacterium namnetense]EGR96639.1 hypothetical protein HMPREF1162_1439 [ [[Propionibacterium] namnetense SK182B-JCVI]TKW71978.1 MAG: hypothetical protein DI580_06040 [Cutibacterium acnes]
MTTIADVKTEVDRVFDASGAPYWPNPHADNSIAAEEEYSRVTDPQKYHVLVLRLQAWQTVLAKMCGVDVDTRAKGLGTLRQRWSSPHSDTLPLYASVVTLDQVPFVGLSVTSDTDPFDIVPDCACDACDYGSQDLLRVLDADLTAVVDGSLVVVTGPVVDGDPTFHLVGTGRGCAVTWGEDEVGPLFEPEAVIDAIRSGDDPLLPPGCTVRHGRSWL